LGIWLSCRHDEIRPDRAARWLKLLAIEHDLIRKPVSAFRDHAFRALKVLGYSRISERKSRENPARSSPRQPLNQPGDEEKAYGRGWSDWQRERTAKAWSRAPGDLANRFRKKTRMPGLEREARLRADGPDIIFEGWIAGSSPAMTCDIRNVPLSAGPAP
jgi:hypothetical protein